MSVDDFKYYVIFVDHFTKYVWLYPLKRKSQVYDVFVRFKSLVENHFQRKIITLYSENWGEYQALPNFLATNGVSHLTSPPHTPEHNGYSERNHRHIVETGLSLLSHAFMPLSHWSFAFSIVVYLINCLPTPTLNLISPYHKLFGIPPNYSKLYCFGCPLLSMASTIFYSQTYTSFLSMCLHRLLTHTECLPVSRPILILHLLSPSIHSPLSKLIEIVHLASHRPIGAPCHF